jgi:hypothetical protein
LRGNGASVWGTKMTEKSRHERVDVQPLGDDAEQNAPELELHIAEYSALMARATNYIALKTSIWPLMAIYLALVAQICKPDNMALDVAFANLLRHPLQRALLIWGNLLVLELMLKAFSQFMIEQYEIVLYIEKRLRRSLVEKLAVGDFWGYEKFHGRNGLTLFSSLWDFAVGLGACGVIGILCCISWPLNRFDFAGLAIIFAVLALFAQDARVIKRLQKEWQIALGV